ncbi:GntP family permease [Galactobacter caseinivorans]|uniref:GntP family permease n=1 Tax=Galactobacter caseinivorans TaxID=2676123 RepID=A0A496PIV5_9MICC|nr:GntP family permease [Galactobacter caseinivorans]RKW70397.1 GntP family permease [Galactobacter caseinivorans]
MMIEGWTQTMPAWALLLIAAGAVALLLVMIIYLKIHALLSLVIVSLITAFAAGIPAGKVVGVLTGGFGGTLGTVALLVGLGAMLGRLVETSGGAQVLADRFVKAFGEKRAAFALGVASLLFGFPIFFDAGLVVMLPVVFAVARRLNGSLLTYGLAAAGGFSVMHVFVPPHPGPVSAATFLGANVGLVLLLGLVVALPAWYFGAYLFARYAGKKWVLPIPALLGEAGEKQLANPPRFGVVMSVLLLPLVLIFMNTGLSTLAKSEVVDKATAGQSWFQVLVALGETPVALLITVVVASVVLGLKRGLSRQDVQNQVESALGPVCSVILITGAGGMFGGVLRSSGIGDALSGSLESINMPLFLAGFVIAALLRVAQGSATVALTTTAGLIAEGVATAGYNPLQLAAMALVVAAGSVIASHVNDSGFWLVSRFFEMDVKTTLKTWTVLETLISLIGFAVAAALFGLASLM